MCELARAEIESAPAKCMRGARTEVRIGAVCDLAREPWRIFGEHLHEPNDEIVCLVALENRRFEERHNAFRLTISTSVVRFIRKRFAAAFLLFPVRSSASFTSA